MEAADLSYRPATYWPVAPTIDQLLSRIKGQARRDQARAIMESEGFAGLSAFLARETLSDDERSMWGAIHPLLMGGEYLPNLKDGEIEIARVSLASTTGDQISVRAISGEGTISYSVVDEYSTKYALHMSESVKPLTLAELVALIDGAEREDDERFGGLVKSHWNLDDDSPPKDVLRAIGFVRVESGFYPGLAAHYAHEVHGWLSDRIADNDADSHIDSDTQYRIGDAYAQGRGLPQNSALAASWWQKSAAQGFAAAQCALSGLYFTGRGVPQDFAQAVYWARQAAEAGHSLGQTLLGFSYAEGNGVPQDDVEAHKWFDLAAQRCPAGQPNDDAARRDALGRRMTQAQVVEARGRAEEWQTTFGRHGLTATRTSVARKLSDLFRRG